MRLHRLTLTAFGPFGTTQEVDFDALSSAGLFLLHGPTGAGKTSVLDAVCFALYGAVPGARQSPGATLRSDHAPAGLPTEVQLELTVGGRRL
ncbi:Rad50/SbcC-type AAA domain-containing protein OS=Streptomyces microflavus OX=1919 GN=Smic_06380 PE=4 SV=1 [Streptomyces microflavus]